MPDVKVYPPGFSFYKCPACGVVIQEQWTAQQWKDHFLRDCNAPPKPPQILKESSDRDFNTTSGGLPSLGKRK